MTTKTVTDFNPNFNPHTPDKWARALAREFGGIFALDLSDMAASRPRLPNGQFASQDILNAHLGLDEDCCELSDGFQIVDNFASMADERADRLFEMIEDDGMLVDRDVIDGMRLDPCLTAMLHEEYAAAVTREKTIIHDARNAEIRARQIRNRKMADARNEAAGYATSKQRRKIRQCLRALGIAEASRKLVARVFRAVSDAGLPMHKPYIMEIAPGVITLN